MVKPRSVRDLEERRKRLLRTNTPSWFNFWSSSPVIVWKQKLDPYLSLVLSLQVFGSFQFVPNYAQHSSTFLPSSGGSR
jgi:hypothetical protein